MIVYIYIYIYISRVNVIAYDYTGYGTSEGMPTEKQTYKDIESVYDW